MQPDSLREQIIARLATLNEDDLRRVLALLDELAARPPYDPAQDPILTGEGLFEDDLDLSSRVNELLHGERERINVQRK